MCLCSSVARSTADIGGPDAFVSPGTHHRAASISERRMRRAVLAAFAANGRRAQQAPIADRESPTSERVSPWRQFMRYRVAFLRASPPAAATTLQLAAFPLHSPVVTLPPLPPPSPPPPPPPSHVL
uniref:Uncharacterized protein n=1 Tax=Plectus sambesii TaxID=2011161 RepID=A0A914UPJ6_9BILA